MEGFGAVEGVRKIIGSTNPKSADVGTIRADYTPDAYLLANLQQRSTRNLIHASDSDENAKKEIELWFDKSEIMSYETAIEKVLYDEAWTD